MPINSEPLTFLRKRKDVNNSPAIANRHAGCHHSPRATTFLVYFEKASRKWWVNPREQSHYAEEAVFFVGGGIPAYLTGSNSAQALGLPPRAGSCEGQQSGSLMCSMAEGLKHD